MKASLTTLNDLIKEIVAIRTKVSCAVGKTFSAMASEWWQNPSSESDQTSQPHHPISQPIPVPSGISQTTLDMLSLT